MKAWILAAITSLVITGQAQALSCVRPDVARTFAQASAAQENYIILHGTFAFNEPAQNGSRNSRPATVKIRSVFNGHYLGDTGFVAAPPLDVTLEFKCLSAWCGSLSSRDEIVAFVQQSDAGYMLSIDPCFSTVFTATEDTVRRVTSCMQGTGCDVAPS